MDDEAELPCPYTMKGPPASSGRALLSRLLWEWCCTHHGLSSEEVAAALEPDRVDAAELDAADREQVAFAVRLIGGVLADGAVRTFARPFGGGDPVALRPGVWEIDDHRRRFATSAIDPERPFDPAAAPTHWIFVDADDGERLVGASIGRPFQPRTGATGSGAGGTADPAAARRPAELADIPVVKERLLRREEVERRTGLPRSSIYARIKQGRFPAQLDMGGNTSGWRESEVDEWIASPR